MTGADRAGRQDGSGGTYQKNREAAITQTVGWVEVADQVVACFWQLKMQAIAVQAGQIASEGPVVIALHDPNAGFGDETLKNSFDEFPLRRHGLGGVNGAAGKDQPGRFELVHHLKKPFANAAIGNRAGLPATVKCRKGFDDFRQLEGRCPRNCTGYPLPYLSDAARWLGG